MIWLFLTAASAFFLGLYEFSKKHAVRDNAVWLVLLYSTLTAALIFLPVVGASRVGWLVSGDVLYIPEITVKEHFLIILKTGIVLTSWICSYFAVKFLPLTIAAPIRSTGPVWTLMGALVIYHEKLTSTQWLGMLVTLIFFFLFSTAGKREGISFRRNHWVWLAVLGTLFSSASGLFDKFLIHTVDRMAVQAYFSIYQVLLLLPVVIIIRRNNPNALPMRWRWSVPAIAILLIVADFLYFLALDYPDSLISVVSALRRGSVIIAFTFGALFFHERNLWRKGIFMAGILVGILILLFGKG
jgi:transporter family protein